MTPKKVQLVQSSQQFQLQVDGEPFYIKGAGLELGSIESLARYGGNAFRTWRVANGEKTGREILDEAHRYGLMVCMGLDVARERHGFNYSDKKAVAQQLAMIKADVLALKDHPALLMWGIGNELNLRHANPKVWDAVNQLSKMIHKLDPNHPTTTMLAGAEPDVIQVVMKRCPDLDLLSFQLYGDINKLPQYLKASQYLGAYIVSEWGATGHWEVKCTNWGRPLEPTSSEKASSYKSRYLDYIAADKVHCVGSFVFLWGQKQERTPTWYGVFLEDGRHTEAAQIMEALWTGKVQKHKTPGSPKLTINGVVAADSIRLVKGNQYRAQVICEYPKNSSINYRWELMAEVEKALESDGGDFEPKPDILWCRNDLRTSDSIAFKAPDAGEYRLFVYINDSFGGSATANMPLLVESLATEDHS
jgi:hypothetical protein